MIDSRDGESAPQALSEPFTDHPHETLATGSAGRLLFAIDRARVALAGGDELWAREILRGALEAE